MSPSAKGVAFHYPVLAHEDPRQWLVRSCECRKPVGRRLQFPHSSGRFQKKEYAGVVDQSDIQPNRKKKKKRKSLLRRATELTGLVTAALALGGAYFTHVPAQIPQPDAKRFLARYFEGAPRDPDKVLTALTTTEFQEGQELNEESYADFGQGLSGWTI